MSNDRPDNANILMEVALQLGATLELPGLLRLVLDRVVSMLQAERALFALFDDQGRIEQAVTHEIPLTPGSPPPISNAMVAEVLRNKVARSLGDASTDADFGSHESIRLNNLKFVLAVPVLARLRVAGVLYVDSRAPRLVDINQHMQTLEALARLVGTAVENAQLFEEQKFRVALLAQLAHDLATPLMVVGANTHVLRREVAPGTDSAEMLSDIEISTQKMERMIRSTLRLSAIGAGAGVATPDALDMAEALRGSARALRLLAGRHNIRMDVRVPDTLPPAWTVYDRVDVVLDNLLFNALKYATPGSTITLAVDIRADAGPVEAQERPADSSVQLFRNAAPLAADPSATFLEISIHNDGAPVRPDLLPRLFRAYVRGDEFRRGVRATGLGLAIVDQCVRSLGGCVWVDSAADRGTRFAFTLPTRLRAP